MEEVMIANDSNFNEILSQNDKVIVKFYADWCGSCKLFAPKFKRLSNDEQYKSVKFIKINGEENPEARQAANVDNLPFFATFLNGKLEQAEATSKEENVVAMIQNLLSK